MTRWLFLLCAVISTGMLAGAYFGAGYTFQGYVLVFLMLVWIGSAFLRRPWISAYLFFLYFVFAASGFWLNQSTGSLHGKPWLVAALLIGGAVFALLTSDLADFDARLRLAAPEDDAAGLERAHLLRLLAFALAGGALSLSALTLHAVFSFEWIVVLVIVAMWGLVRLVNRLLQKRN